MKEVSYDIIKLACYAVAALALLAVCSGLETFIFQTVFRFLHFNAWAVFACFMAGQTVEMAVTEGRGVF